MRIRQALAPALQATLLGLMINLGPSFLLEAQLLPILRDVTREAGLKLVTILNVQPVTGEGKWDRPGVFPSPGSS